MNYLDEGFRCLYSVLLTGKPTVQSTTYTEDAIHCQTGAIDSYIHLDFKAKHFAIHGTIFQDTKVILPAIGDYSLSIMGNVFYSARLVSALAFPLNQVTILGNTFHELL